MKLQRLSRRIKLNTHAQEGDKPAEDIRSLLTEHRILLKNITQLDLQISNANANFLITIPAIYNENELYAKEERMTLSAAMTYLSITRDIILFIRRVTASSSYTKNSSSGRNKELRWIRIISIENYEKEISYFEELERILEVAIQEGNWYCEIDYKNESGN